MSLYIDNDFAFNTDRYYTHGWGIKYSSVKLNNFAANYSLFQNTGNIAISLNQKIYTPKDRTSSEKLSDDMPYSGLLYISVNSIHQSNNFELKTDFSLGIIGESAFGEETQKAIHTITPSALNPKGWNNQLSDDMLINYSIYIYYPITSSEKFKLKPFAGAGIGTLHNYVSIGLYMNSKVYDSNDFAVTLKIKNETIYSLYDSRMQGTFLFSEDEALKNSQINNVHNFFKLKSEITFYKLFFGIDYNLISRQLKSGFLHQFLTFEIGFFI